MNAANGTLDFRPGSGEVGHSAFIAGGVTQDENRRHAGRLFPVRVRDFDPHRPDQLGQ